MNRLALCAATALAALITTPVISAEQPEHAVQVVEGQEPTPIGYHQYTNGAEISPGTDIDIYTFCGVAGESVDFHVFATANGMDPQMEIYDPDGMLVMTQACGHTCTFLHTEDLTKTGVYTIVMSDSGTDESGSYRLQIEPHVPKLNMPSLEYGVSVSGTISPATDKDWYLIAMEAGRLVRFSIQADFDGMDPILEIRDPTAQVIASQSCSHTCSFTLDVMPTVTGVHVVSIRDNGLDEAGAYQLSATCLLGGCPSEPASLWLNLGDGLAGSAGCPMLFADESTTGSTVTLKLDKALPDGTAWLVLGVSQLSAPFKQGILVPSPDILLPNLPLDETGALHLAFDWPPAGVPNGVFLYWQYWIPDAGGPAGFAASNGVLSTTP